MSDPKQAILLDGDDSEEEDEEIGVVSLSRCCCRPWIDPNYGSSHHG
jgi:hypothetical protein